MDVLPKLFAQLRYSLERSLYPGLIARHAALLPKQLSQFAMERSGRALALNRQQLLCETKHIRFGFLELRVRGGYLPCLGRRKKIGDGIREHEVAVGQALHQGAGS